MPDRIQSNRIICEGGLDSTENHLSLSLNKPGSATSGINYEVGIDGGYRKVSGYLPLSEDYPEVGGSDGEGRVLGVMLFEDETTGITDIFAARKKAGETKYGIWKYDSGSGWIEETLGFDLSVSGVTKVRYAVGSNGAENLLVFVDGANYATIYDGTTWSQIKVSNTGADLGNAGGDQGLDAPSLVDFFKQTLFLAGDSSYPGVVAYSAPSAFFDFTAANGGGQAIAGFKVAQIKPFRDELYVFGRKAIRKLSPDVSAGFLIKDVTNNIGCVAADSVMEIGGSLVFLAPDGFRPVAGTEKIGDVQLETISKPIHSLVRSKLLAGLPEHVNGVVIRGKSQFRVFFSSEGTGITDSRGILGSLRTADQQNGWEFFETLGFRVSCATSGYVGDNELVLHGDFDGVVYRQEVGGSLNGEPMLTVYSTPYLDLGDTEVRKTIEKTTLFIKASDTASFTSSVEYDWGDINVTNPAPYSFAIDVDAPEYGSGLEYGDGVTYGGLVQRKLVTNMEGSFFSIKITLSNLSTEEPYSVHGFIIEYKEEGRR